jgi:uncharacterized LabA/DUF88 family protein
MEKKLLIIIDAQNLFYSLRDLYGIGARLDFLKLREIACRKSRCTSVRAYVYFTSFKEDLTHLEEFLIYNGFDVNTKYLNDSFKGNVDSQIIVDAITESDAFDVFAVGSGDSDYIPLVENLRQKGKEVGIISFDATSSKKLEEFADWTIHLDERIIL